MQSRSIYQNQFRWFLMTPIEKANNWFSKYIRLRDSIAWQKKNRVDIVGIQPENLTVCCCSCPRIGIWTNFDAGHWLGRGSNSGVYFNEKNAHAQCTNCNRTRNGNMGQYDVFMFNKYSQAEIEELQNNSKLIMDMGEKTLEAVAEMYKSLYEGLLEMF